MADTLVTQQYHQMRDEESFSSEPTPVPNEYRPPPPIFQPRLAKMKASTTKGSSYENQRHQENSLLNSTLLSLSVDDVGTLPSLAFDPPSPLSEPSESIFEEPNGTLPEAKKNGLAAPSSVNGKATSPSITMSFARARRKQQRQQRIGSISELQEPEGNNYCEDNQENPPMHEVYMSDRNTADSENHRDSNSTVGGESDTFFECVEDRSLANRARRTMQLDVPSSSHRTVQLPNNGPQLMAKQYNYEKVSFQQALESVHENVGSDDVVRVHESALNALQRLKEELVICNQRNKELMQEREIWKEEEQHLRQEVIALQTTDRERDTDLKRLRQDHEKLLVDSETTEKQRDQLVEEKENLVQQSRDSARTIKEFRHRVLAADNRYKELKVQVDKMKEELESASSIKVEMEADFARVQSERNELKSQIEEAQKELSEATLERDQTTSDGKKIESELRKELDKLQEQRASSDAEIRQLNSCLRKANEAIHRLKGDMYPSTKSGAQHVTNLAQGVAFDELHHASMVSPTSAGSEYGPPPTLDSAIADRLARLRDSAERAHLIRGHKRELTRLKADRDAKIEHLESTHADELKRISKQFDAKRKVELEELSKNLNQQHESSLEDVEEEHRKRLSQLQKDYARSQEESEESLEEALTRIARVTQDHGREKGRRHALERTVEDLQRKMRKQQKELQTKHSAELEKRRRDWESEKEILLGNLQRDCNFAFDNRRRGMNDNTNNNNWVASAINVPTTTVRCNNIQNGTVENPESMPSNVQGQIHRPPSSQHQRRKQSHSTGPSPLSMGSASFFPDDKNSTSHQKVTAPTIGKTMSNSPTGGTNYIEPSPRRTRPASPIDMFTGIGKKISGGSPSIISTTYSDIDCVLRETEELVQSIL